MLQAPRLDCELLYPFPFLQDLLTSSKIDVCRREVVQALVQTLMIVVFHEGDNLSLQFTRQIIVVQQDPVLQRLMSAFALPLCLRVIWGAANMLYFLVFQPFSQFGGDV